MLWIQCLWLWPDLCPRLTEFGLPANQREEQPGRPIPAIDSFFFKAERWLFIFASSFIAKCLFCIYQISPKFVSLQLFLLSSRPNVKWAATV
jgi:hypothetical protein